jgi:hypothetical protein
MEKSFKDYLTESRRQYDFRIKIAGPITNEQEDSLKTLLDRFSVNSFKRNKKTPIQALPLDFPKHKNCEVNIYEVVLDYPTTSYELREYLSNELKMHPDSLVVRRPGEPTEEYQEPAQPREGALLNDPDYKEATKINTEDYYGDAYNKKFVKELNDLLKLERKARGEQIPTESAAKYNTDSDAGSQGVLKQAEDPRK